MQCGAVADFEIITPGITKKPYKSRCPMCECVFRYNLNMVKQLPTWVDCPWCTAKVLHNNWAAMDAVGIKRGKTSGDGSNA